MKNIKFVLALLVSLVVTACGGGGDAGLGNSAPSTPLDITAKNALTVTAATLNTMSGSTVSAFTPDDFLKALNNVPCLNIGGSVNYFPSTATSGTLRFSNCGFVANKSYNGTVAFSNLSANPNISSPTDASVTMSFDLTVNRNGFSPLYLLGDFHLSATGLFPAPTTITTTTGTSLKLSSNIIEVISNFAFVNELDSIYSKDTNIFSLASSLLGGKISCQTTTPFVTNIASSRRFPYTGVAIVTGAFNSNKLRITILGDETSTNQVQVELDTGLGYGSPVNYTWAQLFP